MHPQTLRLTAWVLLLVFPGFVAGQSAQASLQAQGAVKVNGGQVPGSTTVFAGDRIQTLPGGNASLSAQGLAVTVPENTTVIFGERALDLGCGSLLVSAAMGEVVRVSGLVITPAAGGMSRFEVSNGNGMLRVSVREGSVSVRDNGAVQQLAQGQEMSRATASYVCGGPVSTTAPGTARFYIPAAFVAAVSALIAYCAVNGFCSEESPSAP